MQRERQSFERSAGAARAGSDEVRLRPVVADDLPTLFDQQLDADSQRMAAFVPRDPADRGAFMEHWTRLLADDAKIKMTVLLDGQVAGNIGCFEHDGQMEVGYWIGREYRGRNVATRALREFLAVVSRRPIHAGVAADNIASIRVLEKCGFVVAGTGRAFSRARGEDVDELLMVLEE